MGLGVMPVTADCDGDDDGAPPFEKRERELDELGGGSALLRPGGGWKGFGGGGATRALTSDVAGSGSEIGTMSSMSIPPSVF